MQGLHSRIVLTKYLMFLTYTNIKMNTPHQGLEVFLFFLDFYAVRNKGKHVPSPPEDNVIGIATKRVLQYPRSMPPKTVVTDTERCG
jgi:hypothetical protein